MASIRAHWLQYGPPVHIALAYLAPALGGKLTSDPRVERRDAPPARDLSETLTPDVMSDVIMPVAGGDTAEATLAILRKLKAMEGK